MTRRENKCYFRKLVLKVINRDPTIENSVDQQNNIFIKHSDLR